MRHALRALAIAASCVLLAGCGKSTSSTAPVVPGGPTDAELVTAAALAHADYLRDDVYDVTTSATASARAADPYAAIDPWSFFRWYSSGTRDLAVTLSDPDTKGRPQKADVLVTRDLRGMMHIVKRPAVGSEPDTHQVVHKFIRDLWTRHLTFERIPDPAATDGSTIWVPTGISPVRVRSLPGTRVLTSVQIALVGVATPVVPITDPTQPIPFTSLTLLPPGFDVTITATTGTPGEVAMLYTAGRRMRMTDGGDGTYSATVPVDLLASSGSLTQIGVNVMTHDTLYDDTLPYDSLAWVIPVRIAELP